MQHLDPATLTTVARLLALPPRASAGLLARCAATNAAIEARLLRALRHPLHPLDPDDPPPGAAALAPLIAGDWPLLLVGGHFDGYQQGLLAVAAVVAPRGRCTIVRGGPARASDPLLIERCAAAGLSLEFLAARQASPRPLYRRLAAGELVLLFIDTPRGWGRQRRCSLDWGRLQVSLPLSAARLARSTGAAIVPVRPVLPTGRRPARPGLVVAPALPPAHWTGVSDGAEADAAVAVTRALGSWLWAIIRQRPAAWLMWHLLPDLLPAPEHAPEPFPRRPNGPDSGPDAG